VETDIKFVLAFPTLNCRLDRHQLIPVLLEPVINFGRAFLSGLRA
jgi:hypothetical protein